MNGLTVFAKDDGTWLQFKTNDGQYAALHMETFAEERVGITKRALKQWCVDRQGEREVPHVHQSIDGKSNQYHDEVKDALVFAEQILGFHEGSEEPIHEGGQPVIWINANGHDGDFQTTLQKIRAALSKLGERP